MNTDSGVDPGHESVPVSLFKAALQILGILVLIGVITAGAIRADEPSAIDSAGEPRTALTLVQAVILGFVEGATEYLPVSSTGHLLIVEHLLGMDSDPKRLEAAHALAICIQSGAILAVVVLYFSRIRQVLHGLMGRDAGGLRLLINLSVAFLPAAVIGLLLHDWIKTHLFGVLPVASALFTGGVIILVQAWRRKEPDADTGRDLTEMQWRDALFVGIMQCLAFWPGFSRSLATILGCRWVNVRMTSAVEFSFLLGLVTLTAVTMFEGLKNGAQLLADYGILMPVIALITAFVSAVVSVKFMVSALNRYGLLPFGYYRILLSLACVFYLLRS